MERKLHSNQHSVPRWNSLSTTQQQELGRKFRVVLDYLELHPKQELSWNKINNYGINHVYKWWISKYNTEQDDYTFDWSETGCAVFPRRQEDD